MLLTFSTGIVPYDSSDSYLQFRFDSRCEYLRKCTTWSIKHAWNLCVFYHFLLQSVKCTTNNRKLWLFRTKSSSWLNSTKSGKLQNSWKIDQERLSQRLVEDTFGIHVQGTVSFQGYDKEWWEFVDVETKDLKNRDKIKVMILESCLHTRKPRSHAEQLCTPLTETSGATVSICEGGEQAVDRLLQNLPGIPSTISPSDFNFLTRKLQTAPSHSRKSFPNCFASSPFFQLERGRSVVSIYGKAFVY